MAAQLQAIEQGDKVPHFDDNEMPSHHLGTKLSRAIQGEHVRELALQEIKGTRCPGVRFRSLERSDLTLGYLV